MSMGFIFIYFYYSLIPYEIWTTHLTLNFHFFFMDMKKVSLMRWFSKIMKTMVILTWTIEMNLIRQYDEYDEGKKLFWLIYHVLTHLCLINLILDVINIFHLIYLVSFINLSLHEWDYISNYLHMFQVYNKYIIYICISIIFNKFYESVCVYYNTRYHMIHNTKKKKKNRFMIWFTFWQLCLLHYLHIKCS